MQSELAVRIQAGKWGVLREQDYEGDFSRPHDSFSWGCLFPVGLVSRVAGPFMGCQVLNRRSNMFDIYTWGIGILGIILLSTHIPKFISGRQLLEVFFLAILVTCAESAAVPFPRGKGTASMATPLILTVIVLYGPEIGIWVAAVATLRRKDFTSKVPTKVVFFNRGMLAFCAYVFSRVYLLVNGSFGVFVFPRSFIAFIIAAAGFTLLNASIVGQGFALQIGISLAVVWKHNIVWMFPNLFALFPLGVLMVVVVKQSGPLLLVLFYLPLMVTKASLQKYIDLWETYNEIAAALSLALDARDSYTHGHSVRVSEYSKQIALELNLSDEKVDLIKYIGLLHDVGKVGLADDILKKKGPFTVAEYEKMKTHAEIGADILKVMKFLGEGELWVRHHHERFDGTGFPDGLAGEQIPLGARIIACADAFDAMTTDRPYKDKMSTAEAKEELIRCSGTQFDPKVVKAMIGIIDRKLLGAQPIV